MTAQPARSDAPVMPPDHPESPAYLASPSSAAWCDYRLAVMTAVNAARLSLAELAASPGDPRAAGLAESHVTLMEALLSLGQRRMMDESILSLVEAQAYERGVADGKAGVRGCLRPVPGPC